jgi:hypothetical protein
VRSPRLAGVLDGMVGAAVPETVTRWVIAEPAAFDAGRTILIGYGRNRGKTGEDGYRDDGDELSGLAGAREPSCGRI